MCSYIRYFSILILSTDTTYNELNYLLTTNKSNLFKITLFELIFLIAVFLQLNSLLPCSNFCEVVIRYEVTLILLFWSADPTLMGDSSHKSLEFGYLTTPCGENVYLRKMTRPKQTEHGARSAEKE